MKNTSTVRNKWPVVLCVISALFFAAMLVWSFLIPVKDYESALQQAVAAAKDAQTALDQRLENAQNGLAAAEAEKESLNQQIEALQSDNTRKAEDGSALQESIDAIHCLPDTILQVREEYGNKVRQLEEIIMAGDSDLRICYLTFDDGPNSMTESILQRLDELDIYATFFTIGSNSAPKQVENLRMEMMAGHTIANHTYSHAYAGGLYSSLEEFSKQVLLQDEYVYEATGFHMEIFRFPSGSIYCPFLEGAEAFLEEHGYQWIDWNASAWDAGFDAMNATGPEISYNVLYCVKNLDIAVVLCHDFNVGTFSALNIFVPKMQEEGFIFLPLFTQSHTFDEPLPII